jgi:hypothetical protein
LWLNQQLAEQTNMTLDLNSDSTLNRQLHHFLRLGLHILGRGGFMTFTFLGFLKKLNEIFV